MLKAFPSKSFPRFYHKGLFRIQPFNAWLLKYFSEGGIINDLEDSNPDSPDSLSTIKKSEFSSSSNLNVKIGKTLNDCKTVDQLIIVLNNYNLNFSIVNYSQALRQIFILKIKLDNKDSY